MKKTIACTFNYSGKKYSGYIISSTESLPHYYWFMFMDPVGFDMMDDTIAFTIENGELKPVYHDKHEAELIEIVQKLVEENLVVV